MDDQIFLTLNCFLQVWVYKKTAQEKFPTLKKYSDQAPAADPHATREVKIDTEYKSLENPDVSIPPEQRTKAFKYGKNYIPISSDILNALKFETAKGIKVIGMVKSSKIPRCVYYLNLLYHPCIC
jgi:ATP-dependent DNA helicase 2 subunit 2